MNKVTCSQICISRILQNTLPMTENITEQNVYYKKKDMDFAFKKMTKKQKIHVILVIYQCVTNCIVNICKECAK